MDEVGIMRYRFLPHGLLAAIMMMAGCSGTGGSVASDSTADDADPGVHEVIIKHDHGVTPGDVAETYDLWGDVPVDPWVWCQEEGDFGCPCDEDADCSSNWCVDYSDGPVCTIPCVEECPLGWSCEQVPGPDPISMCLPLYANLCRPCEEDADCGVEGVGGKSFCIDHGAEGSFCGGTCEPGVVKCPSGYNCQEVSLESGTEVFQCQPDDDVCECTDKYAAVGAKTACLVSNEHGTCAGLRFCAEDGLTDCDAQTPAIESCNLEDDDCNGVIDDGVEERSCIIANELGECEGVESCMDGEWVCEGEEAVQEICDGKDNNCDGETDEGSLNSDEDGLANCVDDDDDDDGVLDDEDNCPLHANEEQLDVDLDLIGDECDPDDDNDNVLDEEDNCVAKANPDQADFDVDGLGDECDDDDDNDGAVDDQDNCPLVANGGQEDVDGDGAGNACDPDDDGDGIQDTVDNCPLHTNGTQLDTDGDGEGDACDPDDESDGVPDDVDNCPLLANGDQADTDADGLGDACDEDDDNDGKKDDLDNCPLVSNPGQFNLDNDAWGDACDVDDDNDGVPDSADNCVEVDNPKQANHDDDAMGDLCDEDDDDDGFADGDDNCPIVFNPGQEDFDGDGKGNACETDIDNDGIPNVIDNCPEMANSDQADLDDDGEGDVCDPDDDGDGVVDAQDNCPLTPNTDQVNSDGDQWGNICDQDDDNDGKLDQFDNCPSVSNWGQEDMDEDGVGDVCDDDIEADGVPNAIDNCPELWNADQADLDWNNVGDKCDPDDDGDGIADPLDSCPTMFNPTQSDIDKDGLGDPCDPDEDGDGLLDVDDNCQSVFNLQQKDADDDGFGDKCDDDDDDDSRLDIVDNCPLDFNPNQKDNDADTVGDICDDDDDNDGVLDGDDNCPFAENTGQTDADDDGHGDACDEDSDSDGVPDVDDNCPLVENQAQTDSDQDGKGNACETDDDNDGWLDQFDNCPTVSNPSQADSDDDGIGNACENDADNDGDPDATDCAKFDPEVFHGALEECDGVDNNCVNGADEVNAVGCSDLWYDYDLDGYGKTGDKKCLCEETGKYAAPQGGDCHDTNSQVNPAVEEVCDGVDNDCDGIEDQEGASGCVDHYPDGDDDGFGAPVEGKCLCGPSGIYSAPAGGDCQDGNPLVNPGQPEKCNDLDDNCDGVVNEEGSELCKTFHADVDSDGFGADGDSQCLCVPKAPYSALLAGDCQDGSPLVNPGVQETCDQVDNNCDGEVDEEGATGCATRYRDFDDDGYGISNDSKCLCIPSGDYTSQVGGDCNDTDQTVNPGGSEACNNEDDDCDGVVDEDDAWGCDPYYADSDQDGYGDPLLSLCLCMPGELYAAQTGDDCNDDDVSVHPGAVEQCDNVDTDCSGVDDDEDAQGCETFYKDEDQDGYGLAVKQKCLCGPTGVYATTQAGDCMDNMESVYPGAVEECNALDDDCDGKIDEGC